MIAALISLTALHLSRAETDRLAGAEQIAAAELLSQSAIELAIARINADPDWRTAYTSGQAVPSTNGWLSLGAGELKFVLVDADGNLSDDNKDAVTLQGFGRRGEAISVASVQLQPSGAALNCLDSALHGGALLSSSGAITCNQTASSNGDITVGSLSGDAWAVGFIAGAVSGTTSPLQSPPREMPDPIAVFDYYLVNGTAINVNSIPNNKITKCVLSAGSNPYGPVNSQGIYVLDCQGTILSIEDCRIEATLVFLSTQNTLVIGKNIHWEPPAPSLPALLVKGNLEMQWLGGSPLVETSVNYNPPGTPYMGVSDNDMADSYPGVIRGLVYASGNLYVTSQCALEGTVVTGGALIATAPVNIAYSAVNPSNPPPGFSGGTRVRIVPGTWKRLAR